MFLPASLKWNVKSSHNTYYWLVSIVFQTLHTRQLIFFLLCFPLLSDLMAYISALWSLVQKTLWWNFQWTCSPIYLGPLSQPIFNLTYNITFLYFLIFIELSRLSSVCSAEFGYENGLIYFLFLFLKCV